MKLAITMANQATPQAPLVLRGQYSESIRLAAQIGYDAVELHVADPSQVDAAGLEKACAASGIPVSSIGTGLAFVREGLTLTSRDEAVRRRAIARLKAFVDLGSQLQSLVIIGLIKGQAGDCANRATYDRLLTEALAECISTASQHGVTLVLEALNHYECDCLNTIDECLRFIETFHSKHLKLHIDTYHMNIEEDRIGRNIQAAGAHIGHVHLADSNRWSPGSGHYDFAETIRALKAVRYAGVLSVECLALPTPQQAARSAYQFMRNLIAAADSI
jgi:sugar phosphate isomerase/epimerase